MHLRQSDRTKRSSRLPTLAKRGVPDNKIAEIRARFPNPTEIMWKKRGPPVMAQQLAYHQ
ncbi:hypothetical protein WM40_21325 [Robbsia andropogonis]|uniref:Uncharacterized protein n=1 Tax=Robbsia andropogonis TaxID=28092 RepID=A0A0F5JWY9_9BURK|nr:hypothetical protein WM40_21325 [Robbsia andropogonis]